MGAVIVDAGLQAGLSYRTVVEPRVQRLLAHWPTATTTSNFRAKVRRFGLREVLQWRDRVKLERIVRLTDLLASEDVENTEDASEWLTLAQAERRLLRLHGIGPKTVAYLRLLVGLPEIAVDRHVRVFAGGVGLQAPDLELKQRLSAAASSCGLGIAEADELLWRQGAERWEDDRDVRIVRLRGALLAGSSSERA
jgi:hypothetical protein